MKILVTGGSGFLGGRIALMLTAEGHEVTRLGRRRPAALTWAPILEREDAGEPQTSVRADSFKTSDAPTELHLAYVRADLCDREAVHRACRGCDVVFHVAGKAGVWGPWREYYEANTLATEHVIAACRAAGVRALVHTSTPSVVFGWKPIRGGNESLPYPPRYLTNYARSKALAEQAVLAAHGAALATVALRPHLIWGPGDPHLMPRIIARARARRMRQVGEGDNLVSFTYIDHAARAHLLAMEELLGEGRCGGRPYFIAQPEPVSLWAWIGEILAALGLTLLPGRIPFTRAYRAGALLEVIYRLLPGRFEPPMTRFVATQLALDHFFDVSAAKRDFGCEPTVSTEEGTRRLIEWLKRGRVTL